MNLSARGDRDVDGVIEHWGIGNADGAWPTGTVRDLSEAAAEDLRSAQNGEDDRD